MENRQRKISRVEKGKHREYVEYNRENRQKKIQRIDRGKYREYTEENMENRLRIDRGKYREQTTENAQNRNINRKMNQQDKKRKKETLTYI